MELLKLMELQPPVYRVEPACVTKLSKVARVLQNSVARQHKSVRCLTLPPCLQLFELHSRL